MIITSKTNDKIKFLNKLNEKKAINELSLAKIEGTKIVKEAQKLGIIKEVFVSNDYEDPPKDAIVLSKDIFKYVSNEVSPQGILATVCTDNFEINGTDKDFLVLDRIQDPANVGAIIRSASAFNFTNIYLIDCASVWNYKTIKASAGNIFKCKYKEISAEEIPQNTELAVADFDGIDIEKFKRQNNKIYGLVVGNEGQGVSDKVKALCKTVLTIKMENQVESLNVAVATGIILNKIRG